MPTPLLDSIGSLAGIAASSVLVIGAIASAAMVVVELRMTCRSLGGRIESLSTALDRHAVAASEVGQRAEQVARRAEDHAAQIAVIGVKLADLCGRVAEVERAGPARQGDPR